MRICEEKIPLTRQFFGYIEIYSCNADSVTLSNYIEQYEHVFQYIFNNITG